MKPLAKKNPHFTNITHDNYIRRNLDNYLRYFKNCENNNEVIDYYNCLEEETEEKQLHDLHNDPLEPPIYSQQVFKNIVPIRIDIEFDQRRYKENLLWNLDDPSLSGE